jgi:hypothetical protein
VAQRPPEREAFDTPFVAGDPSIQRVIDDDEAAVNGEMFKDARLQERIFDQIHAVEFNIGEDRRTAEVGSVLPSGYSEGLFQRVDDGDFSSEQETTARRRELVAARLDSFADEASEPVSGTHFFERVSDEEEAARAGVQEALFPSSSSAVDEEEIEATAVSEKKKRGSRKPKRP